MHHALDPSESAVPTPQLRRSALLLLALATAAAVAVTFWLRRDPSPTIPPTTYTSTHQLPALGIEFDYPSYWHLQEFGDNVGLASMTGALVSNIEHEFHHPDLGPHEGTSAWDMRELPDDLIVVSFEQLDRHNFEARRTKSLPLFLDDAVVTRDPADNVPTYGAPQPRLFLPFAVKGHLNSGAQVFIGDVGTHEREVVEAILASVRPLVHK